MVAIFTGAGVGFERGSGSVLGSQGLLGSAGLGRSGEQLLFNAATGNLMVSQRDEFLVGLGLDACVTRTYNSQGDLSDDNGDNWRQGYDKRIVNLTGTLNSAGSTVQRVSGDGSLITYIWDATTSAYAATDGSGAYDTLTSSGGVWTWTDGDSQVKETYTVYGSYWRLATQRDTDSNTISFTYTGDKLTQVTTAGSGSAISTLTYTWVGNNLSSVTTGYTDLVTSTAKTLTRTRYSYDGQNRLATVTVDLTPDDNSIVDGQTYVTTYTYDGTSTRVASIGQSDGSYLAIAYDGSGRVTSLTQTASSGVTRITGVIYGTAYTEVTDPLGLVTRLDYDANKQLTKVTLPPAAAGGSQTMIQYAYNANGDVTSVTDALGNVTSFSNFTANGNAQTITDREGNVTTRTYGAKNELLTETATSSDAGSSAAQHTVRYAYDSENHLRYRIGADGNVTEYRYESYGSRNWMVEYPEHFYDVSGLASNQAPTEAQLNSWRDGLADRSSTKININSRDARGNVTYNISYSIATTAGGASTAEGYSRTYVTYDQAGRLIARHDQGRNTETFVYDGLGRLTAALDVNGATTTYVFDDANSKTTVSFANGLTQVSTYNKAGELVSFAETAASTTLGAAVGTATHGYDKDGRRRWQVDATGKKSYFVYDQLGRKVADVSSNGDVVEYRYDANNRLAARIAYNTLLASATVATLNDENAVIDPATVIPASHAWDMWDWYVYDKEGRLLQSIDGDGSTTVNSFDGAGRLVSTVSYYNKLSATQLTAIKAALPTVVTLPTTDATRDTVSRSFYDPDGRLLGVLDGEGYLSRNVYDRSGQRTESVSYYNATSASYRASGTFNQLLGSITLDAAKDCSTHYSYDGRGLLRYAIDALGYVTQTDYDNAGQATTVSQYAAVLPATSDYTYDNVKALVTSGGLPASAGTRKSWIVYDLAGHAAYTIDGEGAVTANSYNAAGQLTKITRFSVVRSTAALPTKATMDSWATSNASAANDRVTRYYYDGAGLLRYTVDGEGYVSRTDVDAEGRVTKLSTWANKLTVTDTTTLDMLHSAVTSGGGTVAETLTSYDALGRLEYMTDAEGSLTRYTYRANGQLAREFTAYGTADELETAFTYDNAGRLVVRTDDYGGSLQRATTYSYDGLGNLLTVTDPNAKVTTRTYDRLGQMLTETDALSGVVTYQYDAFGSAVKVTDKLNRSTFNYYDQRGQLISVRDAEDFVTETAYTGFGQVANVTRRYNKATGTAVVGTLPTVTAHAKDAVTAFEYDRRGLITKTTDAEGYYEQYTVGAYGNRTSVRNKLGATITNKYDRRGLLIEETLPITSWNSNGTTQATSVTNKFEYDARGNRTKTIEAFGLTEQRTTNYSYDKLNRLTSKTQDAVTTVAYSDFTLLNAVTVTSTASVIPAESYVYDAASRLKQVTGALGGRTVSFYDVLGRKTAEVGPLGTLTEWTYDANDNMLTARVYENVLTSVPAASDPKPTQTGNYRETVYTYDNLNRLKTTSIANVLAGSWNGSSGIAPTTVTITTTNDYDANGNVITVTDANGGKVYSYYDRLGGKTDQVDAEGYRTNWTYDAEGNVLSERRYATQWTGAITTSAPPAVATDATNDRVTNFSYDRNGHRLTETRTGVKIASVNTTNGTITESTVSSVITYTYNGLGQVLTKAEATGDTVSYTYDSTGRLTKESRAAYDDYVEPDSTTVTPTVEYLYNGLNNLSRTRQGGATAGGGDRITTYAYGANGRLTSITDPAGYAHSYDYDAAGNIVRDSYTRLKADGATSVDEGILYRRDLLGRVIGQAIATKNSATSWTRGDGQNSEYNAYGEISRRGVNGLWQETFSYNNRGLLEKSSSGDGVWRFFVYDKAGNRTLTVEDEHYTAQDLSTKTVSQVLGYLGATAGATFVDGLNVSITTYDKRAQALSSILTQRELKAGDPRVTITSSQAYNAFGEVKSQTDARGYTTDLSYSTMGRLIQKQLPTVNWTNASGVVAQARPTELYYYDASGRMVASRDANNNLTSRTLLAGSGYGGAEALVTAEFHADGGIARTFYDLFGDARILRNELNQDETRTYDAIGRLITQVHRGGLLTDNFVYDILGQRTRHWNSFWGSGVVEKTDYDLQGRVTSTTDFAGDTVTNAYAWSGTVATALGTTGGWTQTTSQWGKTKSETSDIFGNVTSETDFGGHTKTNSYDKAGRLTNVSGSNGTYTTTLVHSYLNTGLLSQTIDTAGTGLNSITATFAYDANGNRTTEKYAGTVYKSLSDASYATYISSAQTLQDATISYDALGRLISFVNKDAAGAVNLTMNQEYDLAGNIRRTATSYPHLVSGGSQYEDHWFAYDAMNRMVIADGGMVNGVISGIDLTYDLAGNRKTATKHWIEWVDMGDGQGPYEPVDASETETYSYDALGQLTGSSAVNDFSGLTRASATTRDALGRVNGYTESIDGVVKQNRYNIAYNNRGQVTADWTSQVKGNDTYLNKVTNTYDSATGNLTSTVSDNYKNGDDSDAKDTSMSNSYDWYDVGKALTANYDRDTNDMFNSIYTSTYTYDGLGRLQRVKIVDGIPRTVHFAVTAEEMILLRDINNSGPNDPEDHHLYVNGMHIAEYTSDNFKNIQNLDYASVISSNTALSSGSSKYYNGGSASGGGEFGTSGYDPINPVTAGTGSNAGRYTVSSGDTLETIAIKLWGDASLWYKLAEANGLSAGAPLAAGQSLSVPNGVIQNRNNADSFRPYEASRAAGDLSPTTRKPPKKNKCGMFGQLLLTVVAIAVTIALTSIGVPAPLAAMGASVASQGVGVATGIQDKFSWKAVAVAGITAGVTAGIDASGVFNGIANATLRSAASAVTANALSQGISVATGLQKKFDWVGVAAAGVGAAAGQAAGGALGAKSLKIDNTLGNHVANGAANMAGAIANAASRSAIQGTSFGDNLIAALPSIIAQTIGGMLENGLAADETQAGEATLPNVGAMKLAGPLSAASIANKIPVQQGGLPAPTSVEEALAMQAKELSDIDAYPSTPEAKEAARIQVMAGFKPWLDPSRYTSDTVTVQSRDLAADFDSKYSLGPIDTSSMGLQSPNQSRFALSNWSFGGVCQTAATYQGQVMRSVTPQDEYAAYERARSTAFLNSIGSGPFSIGTVTYLGGGSPEQIQAGGTLDQLAGNLLGARFVQSSGGRAPAVRPYMRGFSTGGVQSPRMQYMGATPDKFSRTGAQVVDRMRQEGLIVGDGPLLRGNPNNLQLVGPNGTLVRIDNTIDMAHRRDAVNWWNESGRFIGPKSPEVRSFMLDPNNYVLQQRSINRSEGARIRQTYLPPVVPRR